MEILHFRFSLYSLRWRCDFSNYRQIFANLRETLIKSELVKDLRSKCLLSNKQYGWSFSTWAADVRTIILEIFYQDLDETGVARTLDLSSSEAFDRVWHTGFLHKLKGYGTSGLHFWNCLFICLTVYQLLMGHCRNAIFLWAFIISLTNLFFDTKLYSSQYVYYESDMLVFCFKNVYTTVLCLKFRN